MIKLFGSPRSSSGRCFFALEETGAKYETQSINFKEQEHKKAEYLKINPNGKVPALVDGDTVVWESTAINYYICDKYKPELLGVDPAERAHVQQWSIWGVADLQPPLVEMLIEKFFVPEDKKNPEVNKKSFAKLEPMFCTLDTHFKSNDYLVANKFTLAELNLIPSVDIAAHIGVSLNDYPNLQAWVKRCHERDSYQSYLKLQKQ